MPRKAKSDQELGKRIGRNIKLGRTRLGMTQGQLAEQLDIEVATVSRIETGAQLPSLERLEGISKVLELSLGAIISDTGKAESLGDLISEALAELPAREREFLYSFIVGYAQHWRSGQA